MMIALASDLPHVNAEQVEREARAIVAKAEPRYRIVDPGTKVKAADRDNIGEVVRDHGDRCDVRFDGEDGTATKTIQKSNLATLDGLPLVEGGESTSRVAPAVALLDQYLEKLRTGKVPQLHKLGPALDGLEVCPGLITIIGAPPAAGKTALSSQIFFEACQHDEKLVAYVANAEMSPDAILRRELTRLTKIKSEAIRFAKLTAGELKKIDEAAVDLRRSLERVSFVLDPGAESLVGLLTKPPGLLVVDYLQKFAPPDVDARIGVNQVMSLLRKLAAAGHSVLALSATKRDAKGGHASKELSLSSFRESGEVEFQSDSAYVLRDDGPADGKEFVRSMTLAHVKNRHGAKVDRRLVFDMQSMAFSQFEEPAPPRNRVFDNWNDADQGFVYGGDQ